MVLLDYSLSQAKAGHFAMLRQDQDPNSMVSLESNSLRSPSGLIVR